MKKTLFWDSAVILMSLNYWACGYDLAGLVLILAYAIFRLIKNKVKWVEILFCAMLQLTVFCLLSLFIKDALLISGLLLYVIFICLVLACSTIQLYIQETALSYYKELKKLVSFSALIVMLLLVVPNEVWGCLGYPLLQEVSWVQIVFYALAYHIPFLSIGILFSLKEIIQPLQSLQIVSTSFKNVVK